MPASKKRPGMISRVIFRMNADDFLEGGITVDEAREQARLLVSAGADALHVSGGSQETNWHNDPSYLFPKCNLAHLAPPIKAAVDAPVITVGRFTDVLLAEQILAEGGADFVAIGRPLLADPHLLPKAKEGRFKDIRRCVYCLNCTTWTKRPELESRGIGCTVNPALLREKEFELKPAEAPKRVMVVGGGLAGLEAARTLAERGHEVDLYEQSDRLGGQWVLASWSSEKPDFKTLIPFLTRGLDKAGVRVHLNTTVDRGLVSAQKPDAVVIAVGAVPRQLDLEAPDSGGPNVVQALDVIEGLAEVGQRAVVVGGRYVGMEAAITLAREGRHVSLIEALGLGHGTINRLGAYLRNQMVEEGVYIYSHSPLLRLTSYGVDIANNGSLLMLKADTVVLAVGTTPREELGRDLQGLDLEVHAIGDCNGIADALKAISDGAEVGRLI